MSRRGLTIAAALLCLAPASPAAAQDEDWCTLLEAAGNTNYGVYFFDELTGLVGTTSGGIFRTTDGGRTWSVVHDTADINAYFHPVFPVDTVTGFIPNYRGTVARTTNGGTSWSDVTVTATHFLYTLQFPAGAQVGWVSGSDGSMFKTNNGGTNWVQQGTPASGTGFELVGLSFPVDATTGWTSGHGGTILKRTGQHMVCGTYAGNGADNRAITGLGFQPDVVFVKAATAEKLVIRSSTQAGDASKVLVDDAAAVTNRIQSLTSGGFTIGTNAQVNQNGTTYHYVAFKAEAADLRVGTYVGNDTDNRQVTIAAGFQPEYVIIWGDNRAWQKMSTMGTGSARFDANGTSTNRIQAFWANGFEIGDANDTVNNDGETYHYVAWNESAGKMDERSYTGNGADARTFTGLGFRPEATLIKSASGYATALRPESLLGDLSHDATATANAANLVQDLDDDGFEVGTDNRVNRLAGPTTYHAVSWGGKWTAQTSPGPTILRDIEMLDELTGFITCNSGQVLKTTDGGVNWVQQDTGFNGHLTSIWFPLDATTGWVVGFGGRILKTTNGGTNWTEQTSPLGNNLWDIHMLDEATGWTVGESLTLLRPRMPRMITGRYEGDGTDNRAFTGLGFQPDVVVLQGRNQFAYIKTSTMAGDAARPIDGGGPYSLATNLIQSLDADGFTIGSDPYANTSGWSYFWTAIRADAEVVVGTYAGNGADNRSIGGVGFQPGFLMVMASEDAATAIRFKDMAGDASFRMNNSSAQANWIQAFETDGFQVGNADQVNKNGWTYHWVAMKPAAEHIRIGSYTGDGADARAVTGLGFRPEWVIVKSELARYGHQKMQSFSQRDVSFQFRNFSFADRIQTFEPDGFTVGTDDSVNQAGATYHWMAMARSDLTQNARKPSVLSSVENDPR